MHAQNSVFNEGGDGEVIEQINEFFPELDIVSAFALVLEPVDASDVLVLVVASKQLHFVRVFYLVRHQKAN